MLFISDIQNYVPIELCKTTGSIVKVHVCCLFVYISYSYAPVMDNSGSPSIVEQLSQGPSFSYNTFICDSFLAL